MAHYAFLNENNVVTEVIVGVDETELIEGLDTETWYSNFKKQKCVRTSYNSKIRGTYAAIGYTYNLDEDIFITPQPYESWIRNGSFWYPPIPYPNENKLFQWDENRLNWVEIETLAQ